MKKENNIVDSVIPFEEIEKIFLDFYSKVFALISPSETWVDKATKDRATQRSKTFFCIAEAMAEQWGEVLNED